MPYTNDPANKPSDQVRLLVGDTGTTPDLTDEDIAFFLLDENDDTRRAAARAAEALAALYTKVAAEKRVGPLTLIQSARFTSKSMEFMKLARLLWNRARRAGPYAGGISRADKAANVTNSDRVRPAFGRNLMSYPGGRSREISADREDLLSPPSETL